MRKNVSRAAGLLFLLLFLAPLHAAPLHAAPVVRAVDAVGITVSDLERSLAFYTGVLSFEKVGEVEAAGTGIERLTGVFGARIKTARLRLGDESIELIEFLAPQGRPIPPDSRSNDRWFQHIAIIVSDMPRAYAHLRKHRVRHASPGPQRLPDWNPDAGGIEAFYFRDPDGNHLEILHFPPDKGDPKWRRDDGRLFLGIDHTAIVVADTDASLRLYRDALGLRVAGTAENHGIEQERLNNVFGARLRITALKAAVGPGIELLEYLAPQTGRPMPADTRANDLWHWQTHLTVDKPGDAGADLRHSGGHWVSPGAVDTGGAGLGFDHGLLAHDADGHGLLLIAK
ncbi:MAG: VOC family protein [Gammaproteobacteria bacterium]|nr:VOC family protein [Gammaproteobacteria bacterium]